MLSLTAHTATWCWKCGRSYSVAVTPVQLERGKRILFVVPPHPLKDCER